MANVPLPLESDYAARLAKLESTPLFMRSLPTDTADDPTLAALQSLLYEGTPDEVAQNFKEQGNEAFKEKRVRDALNFYTQGIGAKPTDKVLVEALLCNRAACNLELQNYGSALRDCALALASNLECSKAWYRSALALNALGRYEEAIDSCNRCLAYDSNNLSVKSTLVKATNGFDAHRRALSAMSERSNREKIHERAITEALTARKITVSANVTSGTAHEAPPIRFDDQNSQSLIFPVFLLYPQHATSDLISAFHEDTTFGDHLAAMFPPAESPPSWDFKGEYTLDNLTVYATSRQHRVFKVGKDKTLRDAMAAPQRGQYVLEDGLEIREGCLSFVVLPRGPEEKKWVDTYKSEHPVRKT